MISFALMFVLTISLVELQAQSTSNANAADFTIRVSPETQTISSAAGTTAPFSVSIQRINGFDGLIFLSAETSRPGEAQAFFTPSALSMVRGNQSVLEIHWYPRYGQATTGIVNIRIDATSGSLKRTVAATLNIVARAPTAQLPIAPAVPGVATNPSSGYTPLPAPKLNLPTDQASISQPATPAGTAPRAPMLFIPGVTAVQPETSLESRLFCPSNPIGPCVSNVISVTQSYLVPNAVNPTPDHRHAGIDFGGSYTVYSPVSGRVVSTGNCGSVVIEDSRRVDGSLPPRHVMLHMKDIQVSSGQSVRVGSILGVSSNVSYPEGGCVATGIHLHYEIRRNYSSTSAVGLTSCGSDRNCTTASLTYDPLAFPF